MRRIKCVHQSGAGFSRWTPPAGGPRCSWTTGRSRAVSRSCRPRSTRCAGAAASSSPDRPEWARAGSRASSSNTSAATDGHGFVAATATSRAIPLAPLARWTETDPDTAPDVSAVQQATRALRSAGPRWVLGVDDAHLLDPVSATDLHQLATERALPMVLTVRAGGTPPDAVSALWKDGLAERLDLAPLSAAQVVGPSRR